MRNWWGSGTGIVVGIAVGTVVVHVATGGRYGFDRDELMALEDARHLAWGYVTYPPMVAFWGRVALVLFGTSLVGFRFFAALVQAVALVLTGLMAKELGGGKWAQVVAAVAGVPFCLGGGALMQYMSFDYVCWVVVAYCMVRVLGGGGSVNETQEAGMKASAMETEVEEWRRERGTQDPPSKDEDGAPAGGGSGRVEEEPKTHPQTTRMGHPQNKGAQWWWLGVGAGIGLGMMTKYTMGFLAMGVVAGVLFSKIETGKAKIENRKKEFGKAGSGPPQKAVPTAEGRNRLKNPWIWGGALLALVIFLPNLLWQWHRNFVSLEFLRFLHERDVQTGVTDWFLAGQLELTLLAFPLAVAGIYFYFFAEEGRWYRALGWMYVVPLALFLVMRGRNYYLAPGYPMLYAAGAVWVGKKIGSKEVGKQGSKEKEEEEEEDNAEKIGKIENRKSKIGNRWAATVRRAIWVALLLDVAIAGAVALPIAPVNSGWWKFAAQVDSVFPEEIGWPEFVQTVAQVRDRLPAEERARAGILAGNYGEVGALNLYGEKYGLPRAISGVNSSWERGYGESGPETVIVVGYSREFLEKHFASCEVTGHPWNKYGVANEETRENPDIFVCRGLKESWEEFWKGVRGFA